MLKPRVIAFLVLVVLVIVLMYVYWRDMQSSQSYNSYASGGLSVIPVLNLNSTLYDATKTPENEVYVLYVKSISTTWSCPTCKSAVDAFTAVSNSNIPKRMIIAISSQISTPTLRKYTKNSYGIWTYTAGPTSITQSTIMAWVEAV